ncbi:MAG: macrolide ABC transporter ATP-binding protein, partial [Clostridiales bacterium]|nr:macrolide ABC transporter ATP-binding protein [Clostridiales bacterium]
FEASAISLLGSILGIIAGLAVTPIIQSFDMRVDLSVSGAIISLLFGIVAGTLFGFYPAYKASRLVPVEALNAE